MEPLCPPERIEEESLEPVPTRDRRLPRIWDPQLAAGLVVHASNGERLAVLTRLREIEGLLDADPNAAVLLARGGRGSIWLRDDDAWLTFRSAFRLRDYLPDSFVYRRKVDEGVRRYFEPARSTRVPRGAVTLSKDTRDGREGRGSRIRRMQAANRNRRRQRLEGARMV